LVYSANTIQTPFPPITGSALQGKNRNVDTGKQCTPRH